MNADRHHEQDTGDAMAAASKFAATTLFMYLGIAAMTLAAASAYYTGNYGIGSDYGKGFSLIGTLLLGYAAVLFIAVPAALRSARMSAGNPSLDNRTACIGRWLAFGYIFLPLLLGSFF